MPLEIPPAPRWPRESRAACAFTFDLDAETLWMARGVHETVTLSQGRFGPVEALPRILALLRANEIRASFFIPAWVAEHYPDAVRAIADGGHEIGCHGDEHEKVSDLPVEREEAILVKSLEVLTPPGGEGPPAPPAAPPATATRSSAICRSSGRRRSWSRASRC